MNLIKCAIFVHCECPDTTISIPGSNGKTGSFPSVTPLVTNPVFLKIWKGNQIKFIKKDFSIRILNAACCWQFQNVFFERAKIPKVWQNEIKTFAATKKQRFFGISDDKRSLSKYFRSKFFALNGSLWNYFWTKWKSVELVSF